MPVTDTMTPHVETIKAEAPVSEAARTMKFFGLGALPAASPQ
jgi:hypothetical protein